MIKYFIILDNKKSCTQYKQPYKNYQHYKYTYASELQWNTFCINSYCITVTKSVLSEGIVVNDAAKVVSYLKVEIIH